MLTAELGSHPEDGWVWSMATKRVSECLQERRESNKWVSFLTSTKMQHHPGSRNTAFPRLTASQGTELVWATHTAPSGKASVEHRSNHGTEQSSVGLVGTEEADSRALADFIPTRETRRQETTSY